MRDERARRAQIDVEVAALRVEVAAFKAEKTYSENIIQCANYHADDIIRAARQYASKIIAAASSSVNTMARPTDNTDAHSKDEFGLPLARARRHENSRSLGQGLESLRESRGGTCVP